MIKLSLAVPCFNEQDNVKAFYDMVNSVFADKGFEYEFVFVNDGSRDDTFLRLKEIYELHEHHVTVVGFSRNFGKDAAVYAALKHCKGQLVSVIDADLQQRPEVVLEMMDYLDKNPDCDCVAAYQEKRREGGFMTFCKSSFYKLVNKVSDTEFYPDASDFRTFRQNMAKAVLDMTEYHRFSKGIFSWIGFDTHYIPYTAEERNAGETKWSFKKLMRYAVDGMISFTTAPLKIPFAAGGFITAAGLVWLIVLVVMAAINGFDDNIRFAMIISVILDMGGIQLMALGIIGEYLSRMYIQGKNRPIYIEKCCLEDNEASSDSRENSDE